MRHGRRPWFPMPVGCFPFYSVGAYRMDRSSRFYSRGRVWAEPRKEKGEGAAFCHTKKHVRRIGKEFWDMLALGARFDKAMIVKFLLHIRLLSRIALLLGHKKFYTLNAPWSATDGTRVPSRHIFRACEFRFLNTYCSAPLGSLTFCPHSLPVRRYLRF